MYRTARALHRALAGRELTSTDFRVPRYATVDLSGQTLVEVVPRGKHLLARTAGGTTVHSHLKMEGRWYVYRSDRPYDRDDHRIRAVLANRDCVAVGRQLGILEVLPTDREPEAVGHLGPDLLGADWDAAEALRRLRSDPDRAVIDALLDQRNLAGIGNLYKNELMFLRGIHPSATIGQVADMPEVVELAHRMLKANVAHWSQTTTGNTKPGERHWVFKRRGKPCRRCGTTIRSRMLGEPGVERITYWCSVCQAQRH